MATGRVIVVRAPLGGADYATADDQLGRLLIIAPHVPDERVARIEAEHGRLAPTGLRRSMLLLMGIIAALLSGWVLLELFG